MSENRMKIIKLTFWENPTTLAKVGGPRWDCEIVRRKENGDKAHSRIINITKEEAIEKIEEALKNPKGE